MRQRSNNTSVPVGCACAALFASTNVHVLEKSNQSFKCTSLSM